MIDSPLFLTEHVVHKGVLRRQRRVGVGGEGGVLQQPVVVAALQGQRRPRVLYLYVPLLTIKINTYYKLARFLSFVGRCKRPTSRNK